VEEFDHVFVPEAPIAALHDAEERKLAAIAKSLHGVDVEVQHLGHLSGREESAAFVLDHFCVLFSRALW